ncbi:hypothetical protein BDV93DRAFT_436304 [Ceratobasidium sp. AG-I]|nr:hypothetical protein BDV93DRAFT_436304 [Ceratobasidium sp. AG-I]
MEQNQGHDRGSYIWGRSVHNTRIERLWYDVTEGFGWKWKTFFHDLEVHYSLCPTSPVHLWLLHYLFLDSVNSDAQEWMEAWNAHTMSLQDQPNRSPRDLWFFGMIEKGPRGLDSLIESEQPMDSQEIEAFGVDLNEMDNPQASEQELVCSNYHKKS